MEADVLQVFAQRAVQTTRLQHLPQPPHPVLDLPHIRRRKAQSERRQMGIRREERRAGHERDWPGRWRS
jgi:hypothetical protein